MQKQKDNMHYCFKKLIQSNLIVAIYKTVTVEQKLGFIEKKTELSQTQKEIGLVENLISSAGSGFVKKIAQFFWFENYFFF